MRMKDIFEPQVSQSVISDGAPEGVSISALSSNHTDAKTKPMIMMDSFFRIADRWQESSAEASQSSSAKLNLSRFPNDISGNFEKSVIL